MADAIYSLKAEQDLKNIWHSIAPDNAAAADALLLKIMDKVELAVSQPLMGAPRPELSPTARLLFEGRYVVIYEPRRDGIFVVAVVHGARDDEDWL